MNKLQLWWHGHGTKILGTIVTVLGVLNTAVDLVGPYVGLLQQVDASHAAMWALVTGLGGAIIKRGFTNTTALLAAEK